MTSLCTFLLLNEEVDLEKAKKVADSLTNSCESLMIRINDDREMVLCCTTIVPDARSLLPVLPYMMGLLGRAYEAFGKEYEAQSNTN
ncbi:MAG: hypothetical protein IKW99_03685 [Bacteroidales bacterium]|nr:hypothetical protein [Bacteroidales bacterium]